MYGDDIFYFTDQNSAPGDCSCNELVGKSGYGRCEKEFVVGPVCYVNQPSTCTDLVDSFN